MASGKGRTPSVARRARARAAGTAVATAAVDSSPSRYIAKVDRVTGQELEGEIRPDELLVHAHRDGHPLELAVGFLASRVVSFTGNERLVKRGVRSLNKLGGFAAEAIGALGGSRELEK